MIGIRAQRGILLAALLPGAVSFAQKVTFSPTSPRSPKSTSAVIFAQTVSFSPATDFAVWTAPLSVAIGDFNGDGKLDLAVPNAGSNNVSILLGIGAGAFGAATNFAVGYRPFSVAIADLNGDGKLDLAVPNAGSSEVSILLGTGNGSFGPTKNFSTESGLSSVTIGDFNGDGKPDLAVGNFNSNNISILLGNGTGGFGGDVTGAGTGTFGPAGNFPVGYIPVSVAIGDLNGDSKPDLAVANVDGNNVSILLGTGAGGFGAPTNFGVGSIPARVAIGDLNGDGKPDLAVAGGGPNNVSILLGDGAGDFGLPTDFPLLSFPTSLAIGDLNGDGKADLAVAEAFSNNVSTLLGDGAGAFGAATNFAVGGAPVDVAIGDLNGDGKPDLAATNLFSNKVSVLLNTTVQDTTPPDTTITSAVDGRPAAVANGGSTLSSSITFTFGGTDDVAVAGFQCSLDGAAYAPCASPVGYSALAIGPHSFQARALDAAANIDPTPAGFTWAVVTRSQGIQNLITAISNLGLPRGVAKSLSAPLDRALALLNDNNPGNDVAACGELDFFIKQVYIKAHNGQLTRTQANQLLEAANAIMDSLGCPVRAATGSSAETVKGSTR